MIRALLVLLALVELLFPKQVVRLVTRLSYDAEGDIEPKPWLYTAARVEGVAILAFVLLKGRCHLKRSAETVEASA